MTNNLYPLNKIPPIPPFRYQTGLEFFDDVLGGGLVEGSALIVAGAPGCGKSTLLLQVAYKLAKDNNLKILYVNGEENKEQIKMRAERLAINSNKICLFENTCLETISDNFKLAKPKIAIIDSLQMLYSNNLKTSPGSPTQMRYSLQTLCKYAKKEKITIIFVGHSTKSGFIAGLQTLQHTVDAVLYLSMNTDKTRTFQANKNRFGSIDPVYILYMTEYGLFDYPELKTPFGLIKNINLAEAEIYELAKQTKLKPIILFSLAWLKEQTKLLPEFKAEKTFILTSSKIERILVDHSLMKPIVQFSLNWLEKKKDQYETL